MRCLRVFLAVVVAGTLTLTASAADKAKKKAKPVKGVITEVVKDGDKSTGTLTLKTAVAKKKAAAAAAAAEGEEKKFKITEATKIDKVSGKKADQKTSEAKFSDLQKGERVVVVPKKGEEGTAEAIHLATKKKNK